MTFVDDTAANLASMSVIWQMPFDQILLYMQMTRRPLKDDLTCSDSGA